jgi:two-component system sensor histidine kinase AlgZ
MPQTARASDKPGFYLPNLCSVDSLLPLILTGELFALVFALLHSPLPIFDWFLFALLSFEILWIVLSSAAVLCPLRPWLRRMPAQFGVLLCFLILLLVITFFAGAGQFLLSYVGRAPDKPVWVVVQHLAVGGILGGLALHYFYLQQQLNLQQQQQATIQMQARFQALQSRIRPHFLFNSMNIIASLIATDPDTAETVVEDLSTLFRASLGQAADEVPIAHEIDLCERYIHIEHLRLGERLQVEWDKNLLSDQHLVPALSLQPLVENAIYHGIQPLVTGGLIYIRLSDEEGRLNVCIRNPCDGQAHARQTPRGNGMALVNLEQRLLARYGEGVNFTVKRESGMFEVAFSLPGQARLSDVHTTRDAS